MLFFVVIGTIAGIIFEILSSQFNRIERLAYFDSVAELPNKICLQRRLEGLINGNNGKKTFGIITLVVENYLDILDVIGYDLTDYFWFRVARYINNHLPENVPFITLITIPIRYCWKVLMKEGWKSGRSIFLNF